MEDQIQRWTVDKLHRVVMRAVLVAGGVDGDDVGVMQFGRRLRLSAKSHHGLGTQPQTTGEDLQCDLAVQGHLPGLIDDPHAPAAQLADDLEIAEAALGLDHFFSSAVQLTTTLICVGRACFSLGLIM